MRHTRLTLDQWHNLCQIALSDRQLILCSELINICRYYGQPYAEEIFNRNTYLMGPVFKMAGVEAEME
jgi:hypothetical protein